MIRPYLNVDLVMITFVAEWSNMLIRSLSIIGDAFERTVDLVLAIGLV